MKKSKLKKKIAKLECENLLLRAVIDGTDVNSLIQSARRAREEVEALRAELGRARECCQAHANPPVVQEQPEPKEQEQPAAPSGAVELTPDQVTRAVAAMLGGEYLAPPAQPAPDKEPEVWSVPMLGGVVAKPDVQAPDVAVYDDVQEPDVSACDDVQEPDVSANDVIQDPDVAKYDGQEPEAAGDSDQEPEMPVSPAEDLAGVVSALFAEESASETSKDDMTADEMMSAVSALLGGEFFQTSEARPTTEPSAPQAQTPGLDDDLVRAVAALFEGAELPLEMPRTQASVESPEAQPLAAVEQSLEEIDPTQAEELAQQAVNSVNQGNAGDILLKASEELGG